MFPSIFWEVFRVFCELFFFVSLDFLVELYFLRDILFFLNFYGGARLGLITYIGE